MPCNDCHNSPCVSDCAGCLTSPQENCVFIKNTYTCLDVTKGDTLEDVLKNLDTIVCGLTPPSGSTYTGTTGQIDISGSNVISLSNTILTQLVNIQSDISNLEDCCADSVKSIVTGTPQYLNVSEPTPGNFKINYLPGAIPLTQKQGIIDNYTTSTTLTSGYEYTKDFSSYGLKTGDIIKLRGTIRRDSTQTSSQQLTIYDGGFTTNSIISNGGANGIYTGLVDYTLVDFEFILTVVSNSAGNLVVKTYGNTETFVGSSDTDFYELNVALGKKVQFITPLTLSVTNVKLAFNSTDEPVLEQFIVELIRKI